HRHGDPVAVAHAVALGEEVGERPDLRADLGVGVPLVLVDDVGPLSVQRGDVPERLHGGWRRGEHAHRHASHLDLGHRERRTLGGELAPGSVVVLDHPQHHARSTGAAANRATYDPVMADDWLLAGPTAPDEVRRHYDDWASSYDA